MEVNKRLDYHIKGYLPEVTSIHTGTLNVTPEYRAKSWWGRNDNWTTMKQNKSAQTVRTKLLEYNAQGSSLRPQEGCGRHFEPRTVWKMKKRPPTDRFWPAGAAVLQNVYSGEEESACGGNAVPCGFSMQNISHHTSFSPLAGKKCSEKAKGEHHEFAISNVGVTSDPISFLNPVRMSNADVFKFGSLASPIQDEKSTERTTKQPIIETVLETQLKCLKIQNALQQLLLLRLKNAPPWWNSAVTGKGKSPVGNAGDLRKDGEAPEVVTECAEDVPEELNQPLRALLSCSGILITLQQHCASLLPSVYVDSRVGSSDRQCRSEKPGKRASYPIFKPAAFLWGEGSVEIILTLCVSKSHLFFFAKTAIWMLFILEQRKWS